MDNNITHGVGRAVWLCLFLFVPTAHASLLSFGNLVYDTDTNQTWTADANLSNSTYNWTDANAWADGLNYEGFTDWQLPDADTSCSSAGNCNTADMGHLFYDELGGVHSDPITTTHNASFGLFTNIEILATYWTNDFNGLPTGSSAWMFDFNSGRQIATNKTFAGYAWAVRDGAPEAITLLNVAYSTPNVNSGPLVGGMGSLPDTTTAVFALSGHLDPASLSLGMTDVVAAAILFGDALWTSDELTSFSLITDGSGVVTTLSYIAELLSPTTLGYTTTLNDSFSLTIQGTDPISTNDFEYFWADSAQQFESTVVPVPPSVWLFGTGLIGLMFIARRKKTV